MKSWNRERKRTRDRLLKYKLNVLPDTPPYPIITQPDFNPTIIISEKKDGELDS